MARDEETAVSEATLTEPPVTVTEFDAFLDAQQDDSLWELVAGHIVAMTNPTEDHEQIAGNIGAPLKLAMDPKGCRVYQGGIGIQRSDATRGIDRPRPDVVVRCGPSGGRNFITDPLVVIEVLSPSTIDVDRGEKLRFYKALPTLRHIVLIYQEQMRAEHYRRTDEGWVLEILTGPDDLLQFEAIGFEIALERVYFGVELTNVRRLAR
jgi:Uma2 family endonuclease